jgi:hypothetical protein
MFVADANKMISELTGKIPGVERLCATVIDDGYKIRSCGCMVGIIATRSVMRVLSGRVAAPYRGGQRGFGGTFSPKASGDVAMTLSLPAEDRDRLEALARYTGLPIGSLVGRMCDDYCRKVGFDGGVSDDGVAVVGSWHGFEVRGRYLADDQFILRAGSVMSASYHGFDIEPVERDIYRAIFGKDGYLGGFHVLVLDRDFEICASPTAVASVVSGDRQDGFEFWHLEEGGAPLGSVLRRHSWRGMRVVGPSAAVA